MSDDAQIIELLREIRDVQKERLALQRKSMQDTEAVQKETLERQREALAGQSIAIAMQKRAVLAQRIALAIAFVLVVVILFYLLPRVSHGG